MSLRFKKLLLVEYAGIRNPTPRQLRRTCFRIDDYNADVRNHFCDISIEVRDDDSFDLKLFNAPVNDEVRDLLQERDAEIHDQLGTNIRVSLTVDDGPYIQELADAIRGITRRGQEYSNRNWRWVCPRTADSLRRFTGVLDTFLYLQGSQPASS